MVASRGLYSSIAREIKPGCLKPSAGLRNWKDFAQICENGNTFGCRIAVFVTERICAQWCLDSAARTRLTELQWSIQQSSFTTMDIAQKKLTCSNDRWSGTNFHLLPPVHATFTSMAEFQESQGKDEGIFLPFQQWSVWVFVSNCSNQNRRKNLHLLGSYNFSYCFLISNGCRPVLSICSCNFLVLARFLPRRKYLEFWLTLSPRLHLFQAVPMHGPALITAELPDSAPFSLQPPWVTQLNVKNNKILITSSFSSAFLHRDETPSAN